MGFLLKFRLSEAEAAAWFLGELTTRVRERWPRIRDRIAAAPPDPLPASDALAVLLSAFDFSWWKHLRWPYWILPERGARHAGRE